MLFFQAMRYCVGPILSDSEFERRRNELRDAIGSLEYVDVFRDLLTATRLELVDREMYMNGVRLVYVEARLRRGLLRSAIYLVTNNKTLADSVPIEEIKYFFDAHVKKLAEYTLCWIDRYYALAQDTYPEYDFLGRDKYKQLTQSKRQFLDNVINALTKVAIAAGGELEGTMAHLDLAIDVEQTNSVRLVLAAGRMNGCYYMRQGQPGCALTNRRCRVIDRSTSDWPVTKKHCSTADEGRVANNPRLWLRYLQKYKPDAPILLRLGIKRDSDLGVALESHADAIYKEYYLEKRFKPHLIINECDDYDEKRPQCRACDTAQPFNSSQFFLARYMNYSEMLHCESRGSVLRAIVDLAYTGGEDTSHVLNVVTGGKKADIVQSGFYEYDARIPELDESIELFKLRLDEATVEVAAATSTLCTVAITIMVLLILTICAGAGYWIWSRGARRKKPCDDDCQVTAK